MSATHELLPISQDAYEAAISDPENNNLIFLWKGDDADPVTDESLRKAFSLAGRTDLLRFEEFDILGDYYITDIPQVDGVDSRSLSNKYRHSVKEFLHDGNPYYLCLI